MKDVSVVFHAAAKAGVGGRYSDYYAANFIATKNILRASESSSVSAFIYTSSPSVVFSGKPVQNGEMNLFHMSKIKFLLIPTLKHSLKKWF